MEIALDCIQKMVSFKLLQGPVHHINHRWAVWSGRLGTATWLRGFWPQPACAAMALCGARLLL